MPSQPDYQVSDDEQDEEQNEQTGLIATFDYLSIHSVVSSPAVKHQAYGLPYSKYREYRQRAPVDQDADAKNGRIHFWCDTVIGGFLPTLARRRGIALYAYINDMLEEGQIHFHPEYHDIYEFINDTIDDMQERVTTGSQYELVETLRGQKVALNTCSRQNPDFAPRVSKWLAEDVRTVAFDLHMSVSDLAYVYILTGITYADIPEIPVSAFHDKIISDVLYKFQHKLNIMKDMCEHTHALFDNLKV